MKNKNDMYIRYNRSYKKNKNNRNIAGFVLIILLGMIILGSASYYAIKVQNEHKAEAQTEDFLNSTNQIVQTPTMSIPITIKPTLAPEPTMIQITETFSNNIDILNSRKPVKVRGIYVTTHIAGTDYMDDLIRLVDTTEINSMVIDVKDDNGKISYAMDNTLAKEIGAVTNTISDMEGLLKELKDRNIYLIARIVAFKDPLLAEQRQELAVKNPDGTIYRDNNGDGWVNPYKKEVWNYLLEIARKAAKVGFDEIQFDYIRFSTGQGISEADFGKDAASKSKMEVISEFTKFVYEKLHPLGVFVSADVYGTIISSSVDAALVGQDYVEMAKYLDYICPMIYPSHFSEGNYGIEYPDLEPYKIIKKVLKASKEKLDEIPAVETHAIVRPWLQDFTASWIRHHMEYGGRELREQINGVYSAEYEEWLLWNSSCKYSEDGLIIEE